jgi:hypothetical protein
MSISSLYFGMMRLLCGLPKVDELIEKVKAAVPDLLEISGTKLPEIKLHFKAEHLAVVA